MDDWIGWNIAMSDGDMSHWKQSFDGAERTFESERQPTSTCRRDIERTI